MIIKPGFFVLLFIGCCLTSKMNLQINAINAATEAACLILSVDETVKNPKVMLNMILFVCL